MKYPRKWASVPNLPFTYIYIYMRHFEVFFVSDSEIFWTSATKIPQNGVYIYCFLHKITFLRSRRDFFQNSEETTVYRRVFEGPEKIKSEEFPSPKTLLYTVVSSPYSRKSRFGRSIPILCKTVYIYAIWGIFVSDSGILQYFPKSETEIPQNGVYILFCTKPHFCGRDATFFQNSEETTVYSRGFEGPNLELSGGATQKTIEFP